MKKLKKIMALLLAMVMVLGMTTTVMAAEPTNPAVPPTEKTNLIIENIKGPVTVTFYQIAKGKYASEGKGTDFIGLEYVQHELVNEKEIVGNNVPTSETINKIAQGLIREENSIIPFAEVSQTDVRGTCTQEVTGAGIWIAIITEAEDNKVYNPIILSAGHSGTNSVLSGGSVSTTENYDFGNYAVAKSSDPTIEKDIVGGVTEDEGKNTASVGDKIDYSLTVTVPQYPSNATNKTLFLTDTMSKGLRFEYDSLNISLENGPDVTRVFDSNTQIYTYSIPDGKKIAQATKQENLETGETGFYINFVYENLYSDKSVGTVYTPIVTYSAILDEDAVVGGEGNKNKPTLMYSNNPNQGNTWDTPGDKPDSGVEKEGEEKIVYTYQIAFEKTDEAGKPLANAVFGVYTAEKCEEEDLIDIVKTNKDGIAVSTKVGKGTYWVKEIATPGGGYQLNDTAYKIEASWETATKIMTGIERKYTSEIDKALEPVQVGWLKDGKFYAMDEFQEESVENGVKKAYLASETKNWSQETSTNNGGNNEGNGTAVLDVKIPNTKMAQLPSTGGIGTTIFTVAGCAIMIGAVALFFASRKKQKK